MDKELERQMRKVQMQNLAGDLLLIEFDRRIRDFKYAIERKDSHMARAIKLRLDKIPTGMKKCYSTSWMENEIIYLDPEERKTMNPKYREIIEARNKKEVK